VAYLRCNRDRQCEIGTTRRYQVSSDFVPFLYAYFFKGMHDRVLTYIILAISASRIVGALRTIVCDLIGCRNGSTQTERDQALNTWNSAQCVPKQ
jgi:hypothetical protein